jgi:guanylate kinase
MSLESDDFKPVRIKKFTTRKSRGNDDEEVICVKALPPTCDLVYEQYGVRYGLAFDTLYQALAQKETPIVTLNDVRIVQDVRDRLGGLVRSVFVFREKPSLEKQKQLDKDRGVGDDEAAQTRFRKAQSIYRIYIENISLFDHVIINVGEKEVLYQQTESIVDGLKRDRFLTNTRLGFHK